VRLGKAAKVLARPQVFVPLVLSVSLLVFLLSVADLAEVRRGIESLPLGVIVAVFTLTLGYLLLKGWQLRLFLTGLRIEMGMRPFTASFTVGELADTLPAGVYAQNLLMQRLQGTRFATSAAATTFALMFEGAITLITLVIIGIPGWPWLRPAILSFFALSATVVVLLLGSRGVQRRGRRLLEHKGGGGARMVGQGLLAMAQGVRSLLRPGPLAGGGLLSAGYLFAICLGFWIVAGSVGMVRFGYREAVTVYFFGLAVTLLLGPISTQLGVIDATSLGALLAWGHGRTESLTLLLVFRLLWFGSIWTIGGIAAIALRREFRERQAAPGEPNGGG